MTMPVCVVLLHIVMLVVTSRAVFLRESIDLLKENFRDELKKDGARALLPAPLLSFCSDFLLYSRLEAGGQAEGPAEHLRPVKHPCRGLNMPREIPK